jgi:hypothetical protein
MFDLPPSLARYFLDASGRVNYRALMRTPDRHLVDIARTIDHTERAGLFHRLRRMRLNWLQQAAAQAAGINVEVQRQRFLRVLIEADAPSPAETPSLCGATCS